MAFTPCEGIHRQTDGVILYIPECPDHEVVIPIH